MKPDELPAGPELDLLIAETVPIPGVRFETGFPVAPDGERRAMWKYRDGFREHFQPSTDIAAAWEVVEAMRSRGLSAHVNNMNNGHVWTVQFCPDYIPEWEEGHGETAPLAICRAALASGGEGKP